MSFPVTRRELLLASGGFSFLAVLPDGQVKAAPRTPSAPQPVFKALPYLQPGPNGSRLRDGDESIVLAWETTRTPARFEVEWGQDGRWSAQRLTPVRTERYHIDGEDGKSAYHYATPLTGLQLSTRYAYRVYMNRRLVVAGWFTTRKRRGEKTRFVAFGDNSLGDVHEKMIAYQAYRARPDFLVNTGDNVYEDGLANEYTRYFFPVYNADQAHPSLGAPLLRTLLFYTVLANHDNGDFEQNPDCLGYFQCLHLPLNGPQSPAHPMPIRGDEKQLAVFRAAAGDRYPRMGNYSFDFADGHFLCLDANTYVDPTQPSLLSWIETDLSGTDAPWKMVVFHHPAFNAGNSHYREQHMRVLSPLFEKHGVAVVLQGHSHTYQRTRPLRFAPSDLSRARIIGSGDRLTPGVFTVDRRYDGREITSADGVIYLTTGAAGKYLYDPEMNDAPVRWRHPEDDHADYVARFISDRHSFTVVDMDRRSLEIAQIDQWGQELDRCRLTR